MCATKTTNCFWVNQERRILPDIRQQYDQIPKTPKSYKIVGVFREKIQNFSQNAPFPFLSGQKGVIDFNPTSDRRHPWLSSLLQ